MIIEEQDLVEKAKQESLELQKKLKIIKLPKNYYFNIGVEPNYQFKLFYKKFFSNYDICLLYLLRDDIVIYVENNKKFNKIKHLFQESDLNFKIKY